MVALAAEGTEAANGQTLARTVALELNAEGVKNDLTALGMAVEGMRAEATQAGLKIREAFESAVGAQCPCVSGKCPCKCNQPGGAAAGGPATSDPWHAWHGSSAGHGVAHAMSPTAGAPSCGPFGAGAGLRGPNAAAARPELPPGLKGEDMGKITLTSKLFEEKTAREKCMQYDEVPLNHGHEWRSDVFDYFVSKCPAAGPWLAWAEEHGAEEVTGDEVQQVLRENALMTDDLNPVVLSHHVWAFLQHCLSGAGKQVFKATARQDGFNVWRKLTLEINSRTACVRHALRNQCQQVAQASGNGAL